MEEVGPLQSPSGPTKGVVRRGEKWVGVAGGKTTEEQLVEDVQALMRGIALAGRQIDDLRNKISEA
jgi:hypothetical protein